MVDRWVETGHKKYARKGGRTNISSWKAVTSSDMFATSPYVSFQTPSCQYEESMSPWHHFQQVGLPGQQYFSQRDGWR